MLFCKDINCKDCAVFVLCTNIPAHSVEDLEKLTDRVRELKHMAEMMNVEPRLLIEALGGS